MGDHTLTNRDCLSSQKEVVVMSTIMNGSIRLSSDAEGVITVEDIGKGNEYQRVAAYKEIQEYQLAAYLIKVWEADTEAENVAFSSMIKGIKQGNSRCVDDQAIYRNEVINLMTERGIPEAFQESLLATVNEAKGLSNSDGFWDGE